MFVINSNKFDSIDFDRSYFMYKNFQKTKWFLFKSLLGKEDGEVLGIEVGDVVGGVDGIVEGDDDGEVEGGLEGEVEGSDVGFEPQFLQEQL